jgi:hypothetical protein
MRPYESRMGWWWFLVLAACSAGGTTVTGDGGASDAQSTSEVGPPGDGGARVDGGDGGAADGGCRTSATCPNGDVCIGGGVPSQCGGAHFSECSTDADCRADGGMNVCSRDECGMNIRCVSPQCSSDGECGANTTCQDTLCKPKPCTDDGACSGYCVNGQCSSDLGICGRQLLVP